MEQLLLEKDEFYLIFSIYINYFLNSSYQYNLLTFLIKKFLPKIYF
jgi:hypothetical protein